VCWFVSTYENSKPYLPSLECLFVQSSAEEGHHDASVTTDGTYKGKPSKKDESKGKPSKKDESKATRGISFVTLAAVTGHHSRNHTYPKGTDLYPAGSKFMVGCVDTYKQETLDKAAERHKNPDKNHDKNLASDIAESVSFHACYVQPVIDRELAEKRQELEEMGRKLEEMGRELAEKGNQLYLCQSQLYQLHQQFQQYQWMQQQKHRGALE
jgi:hypothetical protein